jgi:monoamine oxidase
MNSLALNDAVCDAPNRPTGSPPDASSPEHVDVVIVGAGVSGLVAASQLQRNFSIAVLEARDRIGGRLFSPRGVDLGGSWLWPQDAHARALSEVLGSKLVPQRLDGDVLALDANEGSLVRNIGNIGNRIAPCGPGASRIAGGTGILAEKLAAALPEGALRLEHRVIRVEAAAENDVRVIAEDVQNGRVSVLLARRVVLAAPPGVLLQHIVLAPPLSEDRRNVMEATATWCGDWCAACANFVHRKKSVVSCILSTFMCSGLHMLTVCFILSSMTFQANDAFVSLVFDKI